MEAGEVSTKDWDHVSSPLHHQHLYFSLLTIPSKDIQRRIFSWMCQDI